MRWKIAAVLSFTAASLAWVLWGIDPASVRVSLGEMRWEGIAGAVCCYALVHVARSLRLDVLLERPVGFLASLSVNCVGYLAINSAPLRLGELVRPYLLWARFGAPLGASFAALFVERLLDLASLVVMLLLTTWAVDLPTGGVAVGGVDAIQAGQTAAGVAIALGALGLVLLWIGGARLAAFSERLLAPMPGPLPKVPALIRSFQSAISSLGRAPGRALRALLFTTLLWIFQVAGVWCGLWAFPELPHSPSAALASWSITLSGMIAVPTPGFFGSFEAFCAASLMLFHAPPDPARTYAVVHHLTLFGFTAAAGLIFLLREGLSLTGLIRESQRVVQPS